MRNKPGEFKKGNRYAKGGLRNPPDGRPTKQQQEVKKLAAEMAQDYIENTVKALMETYLGLAAGVVVKRGKRKFKLLVDPATTRDAVNKLIPAARQEIDITNRHETIFVTPDVNEQRRKKRDEQSED